MSYSTTILLNKPRPILVGKQWKPWKRFHWIEKIVQRWWLRLSQDRMEHVAHYEQVSISHDHVIQLCREAQHHFRRIDQAPRHVVMGPKQLHATLEDMYASPISFGMPFNTNDWCISTILGMTIHVVPWFDGILFLPDLQSKEPIRG